MPATDQARDPTLSVPPKPPAGPRQKDAAPETAQPESGPTPRRKALQPNPPPTAKPTEPHEPNKNDLPCPNAKVGRTVEPTHSPETKQIKPNKPVRFLSP